MRQIVLDTETTGIDPKEGHRIIEIGCVEVVNRRLTGNHFHVYINPGRHIEQEAIEVHGITNEFLADKPTFSQVAQVCELYQRGTVSHSQRAFRRWVYGSRVWHGSVYQRRYY